MLDCGTMPRLATSTEMRLHVTQKQQHTLRLQDVAVPSAFSASPSHAYTGPRCMIPHICTHFTSPHPRPPPSLQEMSIAITTLQDSSLKQRMAATHSLLQEACDMRARKLKQLDWTAAVLTGELARLQVTLSSLEPGAGGEDVELVGSKAEGGWCGKAGEQLQQGVRHPLSRWMPDK
jgi:hypothetical protein